ncbi:hypothetical protein RYX56_23100, partial [Alkalihalophilus lindianensis]
FLFNPRGIVPAQCFKTVRAANHQANAFAVATGVVDVATSNTVNTVFLNPQNPGIAAPVTQSLAAGAGFRPIRVTELPVFERGAAHAP